MRDFSWKVIRADQQMPRKTREFVSECQLTPKDQDRFQRAEAANDNGFVSLPFFAAAIVAGNLAKLPNKTLNNVAALYIGSRIAFNMLYIFGTTSESGHFLPSFPLGNVVANRRRLRHRALSSPDSSECVSKGTLRRFMLREWRLTLRLGGRGGGTDAGRGGSSSSVSTSGRAFSGRRSSPEVRGGGAGNTISSGRWRPGSGALGRGAGGRLNSAANVASRSALCSGVRLPCCSAAMSSSRIESEIPCCGAREPSYIVWLCEGVRARARVRRPCACDSGREGDTYRISCSSGGK